MGWYVPADVVIEDEGTIVLAETSPPKSAIIERLLLVNNGQTLNEWEKPVEQLVYLFLENIDEEFRVRRKKYNVEMKNWQEFKSKNIFRRTVLWTNRMVPPNPGLYPPTFEVITDYYIERLSQFMRNLCAERHIMNRQCPRSGNELQVVEHKALLVYQKLSRISRRQQRSK